MPLTWIEPEVFLKHRGVTVYHAYKDQGIVGSPCKTLGYSYTTDPLEQEGGGFDVRKLTTWDPILLNSIAEETAMKFAIMQAIDLGFIEGADE